MTAAATTAPKSDPRPTSSTPATNCAPSAQALFSNFRVQRRRFSRRNLAADGDSAFWPAGLGFGDKEPGRWLHLLRARLRTQVGSSGKTLSNPHRGWQPKTETQS